MDGIIVIGFFAAVAFLAIAAKPKPNEIDGLEDTPVQIQNIRKGVKNGWYTCTLARITNIPVVRLSGRTADGKSYSDVFRISEADWQTLKREGYQVVQ